MNCPVCKREIMPDNKFCRYCGEKLDSIDIPIGETCRKCGNILRSGKAYCTKCGAHVLLDNPIETCWKCGNTLVKGRDFCGKCGASTNQVQQPEPKKPWSGFVPTAVPNFGSKQPTDSPDRPKSKGAFNFKNPIFLMSVVLCGLGVAALIYALSMKRDKPASVPAAPIQTAYNEPLLDDELGGYIEAAYEPESAETEGLEQNLSVSDGNGLDDVGGGSYYVVDIDDTWDESGKFAAGNGTAESPYIIVTSQQFLNVGNQLEAHFKLGRDIDLAGQTLQPIASGHFGSGKWNADNGFNGVFDGSGYSITGLVLQSPGQCSGLFASVGARGIIKNLRVAGDAATTKSNINNTIGLLVGYNSGHIENCFIAATVEGSGRYATVGCIVGTNQGRVERCQSSGFAIGHGEYVKVGGIAGLNLDGGLLINCANEASVKSEYSAGGITSWNEGELTDNRNSGEVSGTYSSGAIVAKDAT